MQHSELAGKTNSESEEAYRWFLRFLVFCLVLFSGVLGWAIKTEDVNFGETGPGYDNTVHIIRSSGDIVFQTGASTDRGRIDTAGNWAIGTQTTPAELLHIQTTSGGATSEIEATAASQAAEWLFTNDARSWRAGVFTDDAFRIRDDTAAADRLYIATNGQTGIGTSSPARRLHVNAGAGDVVSRFESTDANAFASFVDSSTTGDTYVRVGAVGNNLVFFANNAERARIDGGGDLGINVTAPASKLDVSSGTADVIARFASSDSNGSIFLSDGDTTSAGFVRLQVAGDALQLRSNNTVNLTVDASGDVVIANELKGARLQLPYGGGGSIVALSPFELFGPGNSDPTSAVDRGYRMVRAGSIVGVSVMFNVTLVTGGETVTLQVFVNGATVFDTSMGTISTTGIKGTQSTQARGADTFSAGDILNIVLAIGLGGDIDIEDAFGLIEIVYDT